MLIYEVNLTVAEAIAPDYSVWLREHVRQIMDLDGFEGAAWYVRSHDDAMPDGDDAAGARHWTIHYQVRDADALQAYFDEHAEALRAEGRERFGEQAEATRRVLEYRRAFSALPPDDGGPLS
jgi:hypothetical protein